MEKLSSPLTITSEKAEKAIKRIQKREAKQAKLDNYKNEIQAMRSNNDFSRYKDPRLLTALERNDFDVEKATQFLLLKEKHILELKEKRVARRDKEMKKYQVEDIKELKEIKKKERLEKRSKLQSVKENPDQKVDRVNEIKKALYNDQKITNIVLDGNNMLYVNDKIRKDCLSRNGKLAEEKLGNISLEFAKQIGLKDCLLVFDNTKNAYSKSSEGVQLSVTSAFPKFKSSDDAFVDMAGGMNAEALSSTLFVTSDRELTARLKEKNVKYILRSGEYMKETEEKISKDLYEEILA